MLSPIDALLSGIAAAFREKPLRVAAILCGFLIALVYSGMPAEELTFDNSYVIGEDIRLQNYEIDSLVKIFGKDYWWPSLQSNLYRPFTTLGFWVEYCFLGYGMTPLGYQVTNALLHWINALLIFIFARKIGLARPGALFVAVIYAVHPIATEVVANIVGRSDLLATLGVLGGLLCYFNALDRTEPAQRLRWLVGAGACGMAGVLAKESAIILPAIIAWHGLLRSGELRAGPEPRARWLADAGWSAALLAPAAVAFLATRLVHSQTLGVTDHPFIDNPLIREGFGVSKITAFAVWGQQVAALFNPTGLSCDYSFNAIPVAALMFGNKTAVLGWVSLLGFVVAFALLFYTRKKLSDGPLFLAGAYAIAMLPTSNLIIKIGSIKADRFQYLPSVFFWSFLVLLVWQIAAGIALAENRRKAAQVTVFAWVFCIAAIAHVRCYDWRSNLNLWSSALATSPGSAKVRAAYGNETVRARNDEESARLAIASAKEALAIYEERSVPPEDWPLMIFSDIGAFSNFLYDKVSKMPGREAEAKRVLEEGMAWMKRGIEYETATRSRWARIWLNGFVAEAPVFEILHRNYVEALHRQKRWTEAATELEVLLKKMPFKVPLLDLRAQNLRGQGRMQEAVDAWILLSLMAPEKTFYLKDLNDAIMQVDKGGKPLMPNASGEMRLNLESESVVAAVRRAWRMYDTILLRNSMELERKQLKRAIRYKYGIKDDL
jgi:protein O-mannosyl-transferase